MSPLFEWMDNGNYDLIDHIVFADFYSNYKTLLVVYPDKAIEQTEDEGVIRTYSADADIQKREEFKQTGWYWISYVVQGQDEVREICIREDLVCSQKEFHETKKS